MRFIVLAIIAASVYLAVSQLSPPAAHPESAPAEEFSSGRARKHIEAIAQKPHPVGSTEHQRVRDYILGELMRLGLNPQIQKARVMSERGGESVGGSVENILGRIRGTNNTKSILLVAHYDSAPTSYGASDNGSGVATLLETARALKIASPLKSDVVLLFTDAEETGLLGASAFVEDKETIKDIRLVLNFEARGNSGPSIMFETSDGNSQIIEAFAKSAFRPVTTSFSNDIYKRMPNDTDFSVFKRAGLEGLNFAYIKGPAYYHTTLDTYKNLDDRSLQHHGSQALALVNYFSGMRLEAKSANNHIYFSIGPVAVHYSEGFARLLAALNAILFLAIAGYAFKRKLISLTGALLAFIFFLVSVFVTALLTTLVWRIVALLQGQCVRFPNGNGYDVELCLLALGALALSIFSILYALYTKRASAHSLSIGASFGWLILSGLMILFIPGGSYLCAWPLLFGLISISLWVSSGHDEGISPTKAIAISLLAIPGILLIVPIIYLIYIAMGSESMPVIIAFEALLLGLLTPQVSVLARKRRWWIPVSTAVVALGLIILVTIISGSDRNRSKENHIFYAMNADSGKAVWASFDEEPDAWTSQFLTSNVSKGSLIEYAPLDFTDVLKCEAQPIRLSPPTIRPLSDDTSNGIRTLRLQLTSTRNAPLIVATIDSNAGIASVRVNGRAIKAGQDRQWHIKYFGSGNEGIELAIELRSSDPVKIRAMDVVYGLPETPGLNYAPRPENLVASPDPYSDSTLVSKSFSF